MAEPPAPAQPTSVGDDTAASIWPPPGAPSQVVDETQSVVVPSLSAAQQFPSLDPALLAASVQATAPAPQSPLPTQRQRWQALWRNWLGTRYPLLAATAVLLLISLPRTVAAVVQVSSAFPVAGTIVVLLWLAYAFPLIWIILRVDFFEREPNALIAMALVWGGVIATSMAVPANQAVYSLLTSAFGESFTLRWGAAVAAPITEESLKALGIIAVILLARRAIRGGIDGFVVGAMVGLGFQVVENFVYTGNLLLAASQDQPFAAVLNVFMVRGIGSGLWSHAVYSGAVGLGIGYAFVRTEHSRLRRVSVACAFFAVGWLLHLIWNIPVLWEGLNPVAVVLKVAIILGLLAVVLIRNQGRDASIYTEFLESVHDPGLVSPAEIEALRTYRSREAAARAAALTGGDRAAEAVRRLQRRQADLSVALANGDLERIAEARRGIAGARAQLTVAALLPEEVGHRWGVASIWMSVLGVLLPIVGPFIAAVLAAIGTRQAQRSGAELARSVRAAWVLSALSMLVGIVLVLVLLG